jgi:uncharacterized protein (TIGR03435 family)
VASVKPNVTGAVGGEGRGRTRIEYTPNSLTMRNVELRDCVQWAYDARFYQMAGYDSSGDGWSNALGRFDIIAKSGERVPVSQLRLMLQDLLVKRFKLAIHRESTMLSVYELVVAKGGSKLPKPKPEDETALHGVENLPRVQDGSFVFQDTSIPEFAEKLSMLREINRPVIDRTGIAGFFDITLKSAAAATLQPDGASLFTIIQEQLGLKLVDTKAPIEVFVVDHAEKPSAN